MKLSWTEPAIEDLRDLRDYIAADSDFHAADFIASIITRAERLATFPMIGRIGARGGKRRCQRNTLPELSHHLSTHWRAH